MGDSKKIIGAVVGFVGGLARGYLKKLAIGGLLLAGLWTYVTFIDPEGYEAAQAKRAAEWNSCKAEGWGDSVCKLRRDGRSKSGSRIVNAALKDCVTKYEAQTISKDELVDCLEVRRLAKLYWPELENKPK